MKIQTVKQIMATSSTCYVAKKGSKYITVRNEELAKTDKQSEALAFETEKQLIDFIDYMSLDDRSARVIGARYDSVPLSKPATPVMKEVAV